MAKGKKTRTDSDRLEELIRLNQMLVAIELAKGGMPQAQIGKLLHIATGTVNALVKGYKPAK